VLLNSLRATEIRSRWNARCASVAAKVGTFVMANRKPIGGSPLWPMRYAIDQLPDCPWPLGRAYRGYARQTWSALHRSRTRSATFWQPMPLPDPASHRKPRKRPLPLSLLRPRDCAHTAGSGTPIRVGAIWAVRMRAGACSQTRRSRSALAPIEAGSEADPDMLTLRLIRHERDFALRKYSIESATAMEIRVTTDELRNAAQHLAERQRSVEAELQAARHVTETLFSSWSGSASAAGNHLAGEFVVNARRLLASMEALSQFMRSAADAYSETEQSLHNLNRD
jgi:WXG100 family type VII secretion target